MLVFFKCAHVCTSIQMHILSIYARNLRSQWRLSFANVKRCSSLRLWVGFFIYLNLHLCSFKGYFLWMFFTSVYKINSLRIEINKLLSKGIKRLRKEINGLLSKGMSNIYLKVTIEKSYSKLRFFKFNKIVTRSVFGDLQLT